MPEIAKTLRRWCALVAVNVLVFALLLVIAELSYRIYQDGFVGAFRNIARSSTAPYSNLGTSNWVVYDPDLGYRLRTGREGVNSLAVYGPEIVIPKPPGLYRTVVLGDSVAADDPGFVGHLGDRLRSRGAFEVIRAGIPGYTAYQEVLFFKKHLVATTPDLVLWAYCVNDNHRFLHRFSEDGNMLWTDEARESLKINSAWDRIGRRSRLLTLLRVGVFAHAKGGGRRRGKFRWEDSIAFSAAWKDHTWADYESHLLELKEALQQHNGRLAIIIFPHEAQLLVRSDKDNHEYIVKPQRKLTALCQKHDVPCLDLYPAFSAEYDHGKKLYRDGIHLNDRGHRFTTDRISRFLSEKGLLGPPS
jgi:lysophospholipase L1-like esterase